MNSSNPEIGQQCLTGEIRTNYHDIGQGEPVLLLHGSGPGVSAWANWRLTFEALKGSFRLIAPDLVGFGFTEFPTDQVFNRQTWLDQIVALLDQLNIEKVNLVGNSFGGSMALALAIHHPDRVKRVILMGSVGVPFKITRGLDAVWGYTPSLDGMKSIMNIFAYDNSLVADSIVRSRYEASLRESTRNAYESMFPAPRQRWVDAMSHSYAEIKGIRHEVLLIHGRDDKVIPLETSLTLNKLIEKSQLHIFGCCGHWTQIEHKDAFSRLLEDFFKDNLS
ncbi:2-hydroxymuconic semialdehyde hydrolase [Aequoribacter fuscus]|jgi:2-hydroxymuconate-semialdehyde hydrolase|uniref:2-hydroxymuconic semialdehyde hydrolase n=1 Tax=Aequoribacter fuscus TaxID=2518989 RepID=F3L5V6_9GAMM|nr:alpha/beta hydrolase [Aequoribacter fuscus]EGG28292.1 2-hydroxymuconic semialdehyde hydrolase [Aequoribacter fuscus]QHJ87274.1 alpha/beta fold hydrolase [Aequoribacter fuscus]